MSGAQLQLPLSVFTLKMQPCLRRTRGEMCPSVAESPWLMLVLTTQRQRRNFQPFLEKPVLLASVGFKKEAILMWKHIEGKNPPDYTLHYECEILLTGTHMTMLS